MGKSKIFEMEIEVGYSVKGMVTVIFGNYIFVKELLVLIRYRY